MAERLRRMSDTELGAALSSLAPALAFPEPVAEPGWWSPRAWRTSPLPHRVASRGGVAGSRGSCRRAGFGACS